MKEISKYFEKDTKELFVFANPQKIISDYLNQKPKVALRGVARSCEELRGTKQSKAKQPAKQSRGTKQSPILMENEEWVYFKIQSDDERELIYNILAYSLLEILDGQFLYGFIEIGLAQSVDEFLKIYSTDSFIHEALHEAEGCRRRCEELRGGTTKQSKRSNPVERSEQKKVTFIKLTPPFLVREAIYRNILISLKNEEMLIAFLHEFWEDAMARTEIIVLPVPFEKLDGVARNEAITKLTNAKPQIFFQLESNKLLEKIHVACILYIVSYASEYNILVCCKSIHKEHFLENIRDHCEVMGVKFSLLPA